MVRKMIKAVFLDFDGTVSDAREISFKAFCKTFEYFGWDFDRESLREVLGTKMGETLKSLGIKADDIEAVRDKFYEYFIRLAREGGISPCVSLKPLWEMKKKGLVLTVISNSRIDFLEASLKVLGIEGLFDEVYGAESFGGKDEMLRALFKRMGLKSSEVVYVGDRFSDVRFAREAGCFAVAIHNKCAFSALEKIREERPDYIVRDFYGLRRVLREINASRCD